MEKIIWIDDDDELEGIFRNHFIKNEIEISFASSIAKGMKLINSQKIEFLLLDIKFPNSPEEGYIFLEEIIKANPQLKIILFSSFIDESTALVLMEKNKIIGYLNKPLINDFELQTFFLKLKNLIKLHKNKPKFDIKTIKIFIASSDTLLEERERIEQLFSRMTDSLISKGIYLKTTIWEKESRKFTLDSKQESFNEMVRKCNIFFCLVHDKVGKFTKEEFNEAFRGFTTNKLPSHMYVFFKDTPVPMSNITRQILDVIEMKEEIQIFKQFYSYYNSIDGLLNMVKDEIDKYISELTSDPKLLFPD